MSSQIWSKFRHIIMFWQGMGACSWTNRRHRDRDRDSKPRDSRDRDKNLRDSPATKIPRDKKSRSVPEPGQKSAGRGHLFAVPSRIVVSAATKNRGTLPSRLLPIPGLNFWLTHFISFNFQTICVGSKVLSTIGDKEHYKEISW